MESTVFPFSYCSTHFKVSSGDTRRFDKSMYPVHQPTHPYKGIGHTLIGINSHDDGDLITSNSNDFVDGSDTSSGKFRK
jgi:hypothetical protein